MNPCLELASGKKWVKISFLAANLILKMATKKINWSTTDNLSFSSEMSTEHFDK